ncbi:Crp/Fnr family transcriptional regulator [Caulobacter sp. FWC2]|uniref:Crp/Fnr family transcriptional regulator n=1 Tax=Caulobacter sp. FWC2 TaxID=69664 RepID=UPI000C153012|nr:Crp/Fnr family transcriptional regulator [Caulobacter sp. FWC2]PIB92585.1 cyclic nucleotide-binding protein [Caulobacter sp. FWC2]
MQFKNSFISALSADDFARLSPSMSEIIFRQGQSIYEAGDEVRFIYFPTSAVMSVVTPLLPANGIESETIGHEGVVGLISGLSRLPAPCRAFAQVGGSALQLPASTLRSEIAQSTTLLDLVITHVDLTLAQAQQSAACNATHSGRARLAKWLLMTQDRVGGPQVPLTQEYLSVMLGVRKRGFYPTLCVG